jgi:hypothetical protein
MTQGIPTPPLQLSTNKHRDAGVRRVASEFGLDRCPCGNGST